MAPVKLFDNLLSTTTSSIHSKYKKALIFQVNNKSPTRVESKKEALILNIDGIDQAVVFPELLPDYYQDHILQLILVYCGRSLLDENKDHTNGKYIPLSPGFWDSPVPFQGCIYLSHSNHPVGHTTEPSMWSASLSTTCTRTYYGLDLLRDLKQLSEISNYLLKEVDRQCYQKMVELRAKMIEQSAHVEAVAAVSPALHTTVGIILNRQSGSHKDGTDAMGVWGIMFVLGAFEGGEMKFTNAKGKSVVTPFQRGSAILLKARDVRHEVTAWNGSIRVVIVYYTQNSVVVEYDGKSGESSL